MPKTYSESLAEVLHWIEHLAEVSDPKTGYGPRLPGDEVAELVDCLKLHGDQVGAGKLKREYERMVVALSPAAATMSITGLLLPMAPEQRQKQFRTSADKIVKQLRDLKADAESRRNVEERTPTFCMAVERWADLGIGIDTDWRYLAVSPCPDTHGVFPRESAVVLDLPGEQWRTLLDLLARSRDGSTASKDDLTWEFWNKSPPMNSSGDFINRVDSGRLTRAVANLGRRLRHQVKGPNDKKAPAVLSVAWPGVVQAAFVVRYLVRGRDGKLRFGQEQT